FEDFSAGIVEAHTSLPEPAGGRTRELEQRRRRARQRFGQRYEREIRDVVRVFVLVHSPKHVVHANSTLFRDPQQPPLRSRQTVARPRIFLKKALEGATEKRHRARIRSTHVVQRLRRRLSKGCPRAFRKGILRAADGPALLQERRQVRRL